METKIAPAMQVLSKEFTTTMKRFIEDVGEIPKDIFKSAIENQLHPCGPQYWLYEWNDETPGEDAKFKLTICLPVATFGCTYNAKDFELINLKPFTHIADIHFGSWDNLKDTYGKIMGEIKEQNLVPGKTCREIYINCDFENPINNITEVQFELNLNDYE